MNSPEQRPNFLNAIGAVMWVKKIGDVKRYVAKETEEKIPEMIHRPDVFVHARRVVFLARTLVKILEQNPNTPYVPNIRKVSDMAYHHDDVEIVTEDLLATKKRVMSEEERKKLNQKEDEAANAIAHFILGLKYPLDDLYVRQQQEAREKRTIESQIVDVSDKWDALCEIMHEVRCGNKEFTSLIPFSKQTFASFEQKYPFYGAIKDNQQLQFDDIPDPQEALRLPTITIEDLKKPEDVASVMSFEKTKDWPQWYRTWANLNKSIFNVRPEKFIFPGWYMQLWVRWNTFPSGVRTISGLEIP